MKNLIYILFTICSWCNISQAQTLILINPKLGDNKIVINKESYVIKADTFKLSSLRFYISEIQIHFKNGEVFNEPNSFHLLDIENPESFNFSLNSKTKDIQKIEFNIGIDSLTNVSGALAGDLDPAKGMYWAWQSGYINFKVEGQYYHNSTKPSIISLHIGGYLPPYYALRKVSIAVNKLKNNTIDIEMDLLKLFQQLDLKKDNNIMTPSLEAMKLADVLPLIFSVK